MIDGVGRLGRHSSGWGPAGLVFVVAVVARIGAVVWRGGYGGYFNYDSGVYYAAANALIHGRLPYRDFTLVHPPGSMLALTPFAWLGRATSDQTGYVVGGLAFTVLGAGAAALVVRIVANIVPSRLAALAGGLGYAIYVGSVSAEREARLEPLGNFLLLLGLLCMLRAARSRWWSTALGGAALAAAVSVKIWYVVPAVVVLAAYLATRRRHRIGAALGGVLVAGLVIDGPFFAAAPRAMYRAVIDAQLSRRQSDVRGTVARLADVSGLPSLRFPDELSHRSEVIVAVVTLVLLGVVAVLAALRRGGRVPAIMLVAQALVLYRSPAFFPFYVDYLTPVVAVCGGIAIGVVAAWLARRLPRSGRTRTRASGLAALAGITMWAVVLGATNSARASGSYPAAFFAKAVAGSRCVMSNTPEVLIQLDALDRGLGNRCRNWVDFNGRLLGPDRYRTGPGRGPRDAKWHRDYDRYLLSGDAVALLDAETTNMSGRLLRILGHAPVIARAGRLCVVRVTEAQRNQLRNGASLSRVSPPGATRAELRATAPWCAGPTSAG